MEAAPFDSLEADADIKLHVGFLIATRKRIPRMTLASPKGGMEVTRITKHEVFVVRRRASGRYGLLNNLIEEEIVAPATTRSWNTAGETPAL